ncbi:hypothetical protein R1flu_005292 [Riccia fluitans]|uniref:Expansin n=1 Tax=Riccia fluitans TaxID=41844 RepID=A0ABD1YSR5_9MARC
METCTPEAMVYRARPSAPRSLTTGLLVEPASRSSADWPIRNGATQTRGLSRSQQQIFALPTPPGQPTTEDGATLRGLISICRIPCVKSGGIRFVMNGNPWFNLVLVYNVAGGGNVVSMQMKGSRTNWFAMRHNWGQNWELSQKLQGQAISFKVTLGNGKELVSNNVASADWKFGQTFEDVKNF